MQRIADGKPYGPTSCVDIPKDSEGHLDIYTKLLFTVIAVALSVIAIRDVGVPAFAQRITQVELCGQELNPRLPRVSCAEFLTDNDGVRRLVITR